MSETVLDFVELGIVPQSARGATQQLNLRSRSSLRELANGQMVSRTRPGLHKFDSTVSFSDLYPPAFDNVREGDVLTVHCSAELSGMAGQTPSRPVVPGSMLWRDADGRPIIVTGDELVQPPEAFSYTYRPIIVFMVSGWDVDCDEYGAIVSSSLSLKEV